MKNKLAYNLQFFAEEAEPTEGESVETVEVAEPLEIEEETVVEPEEETTPPTEPEKPEVDVNAIAAAARRKAEQEAKAQQASIDAEYARRFSGYTNPITGQPIKTQADYLAAYDAQEQLQAKQQLEQSGVDPTIIDKLISNNPVIRQAQEVMQRAQAQEQVNAIMSDVTALSQIDPSIQSLEDVPPEVVERCMQVPGLRLVDAYKLVNFDKVSTSKVDAIKQDAINKVKGKQHLNPVNGVSTPDSGVDIPADKIGMWKDMFPEKSAKELKELYNKSL